MDLLERIERTIDELRPYVSSHRGSVEVIDFDPVDGRLLVRMGGTCVGCAASTVTLKQGLEVRHTQSLKSGEVPLRNAVGGHHDVLVVAHVVDCHIARAIPGEEILAAGGGELQFHGTSITR